MNKMEFKAHMSIHDVVDVKDQESQGSNFTRDRFGKNHRLQNEDGSSRIQRSRRKGGHPVIKKALVWALALSSVVSARAFAESSSPGRNTDIQVESTDFNDLLSDNKMDPPREKFGLPIDDYTYVELNEDGDPNLNLRF